MMVAEGNTDFQSHSSHQKPARKRKQAEPSIMIVIRLLSEGASIERTAAKTGLPVWMIERVAKNLR
jgi:hypothetical protein